jgi:metallophosphoesterase (TIGR00282 family)
LPTKSTINILCLGDIVGQPGRHILQNQLDNILDEFAIDFVIANIENSAAGFGFNTKLYYDFIHMKMDAFTSGNHVYSKREVLEKFSIYDRLVRPINFPDSHPGKGLRIFEKTGKRIALINAIGRVFMPQMPHCPFETLDVALNQLEADIIIVDFHAETTSEKQALGWFLNKRVTLMYGTHTHVQTNDARLLSTQTAYITDIGMCGAYDSVIGMDKDISIDKFIRQLPSRHQPVKNPDKYCIGGIVLRVDLTTNLVASFQPIQRVYNEEN